MFCLEARQNETFKGWSIRKVIGSGEITKKNHERAGE